MTQQMIPINEMPQGSTYKGYKGGLYGDYKNDMPEAYKNAGLQIANEIANMKNIAVGTIGASSISMESSQLFTQLKKILGARKDVRYVNACKGGTTYEKMDERYWQFVRDAFVQNGIALKDVKVIIMKSDTLTYDKDISIEYVKDLIDETITRMKKSDLFPNLKIVYFTGRNSTHWVAPSETKHTEPRAYHNGISTREYIADVINEFSSTSQIKHDVFVDWIFYAWTDGINRRKDGWLWEQNFTQDSGVHPSPIGREKFAAAIVASFSKDEIAKTWLKISKAHLSDTMETGEGIPQAKTAEGEKEFIPEDEFGTEDLTANNEKLPDTNLNEVGEVKGNFEWVSDNEADGVRFVKDADGPFTYREFREKYPFEFEEGVYSADEKHATETIEHTVHQDDVDVNPGEDLKVGEKVELPVTEFEKKTIEDAKGSDLPGGETDKPGAGAADSADNVKEKPNADSKKDSKTDTKKSDKKDGSSKKK